MRTVGAPLDRIRRRLRVGRLNLTAGVRIAASAHISGTASIQTRSDGMDLGGRIHIAEHAIVSDGAILAAYGGSIAVEARGYIGPYCVLYGHGGLRIGKDCMIGAHTVIIPGNHGFARIDMPMNSQPLSKRGIDIGEDVWIGAGCKILDGVRIGRGAVIGAGSVVTRDIEAYGIAYGVPASVVRSRRPG